MKGDSEINALGIELGDSAAKIRSHDPNFFFQEEIGIDPTQKFSHPKLYFSLVCRFATRSQARSLGPRGVRGF
jgi:hypothetical protein